MKSKKKLIISLIFLILILFFIFPVKSESNLTAEDANFSLAKAQKDIQEMINAGFNVQRVNDTLEEALQFYSAQLALEKSGGKANYESIIKKTDEISRIKEMAFKLNDEVKALEMRINSSKTNMSEALVIFKEAKKEFYNERYEKVKPLIEKCYKKIFELEARASKLRALYEASTKTLTGFLKKNWLTISITIAILIILFLIFHNEFSRYKIKRKIRRLELEKKVLRKLMEQAQRDYFEKGKIPEITYKVKMGKFSELVRDIDRQIPLLIEEIEKKKSFWIKKDKIWFSRTKEKSEKKREKRKHERFEFKKPIKIKHKKRKLF